MKNIKSSYKKNKTWLNYGIIAVVAITLYATGMHAEVIGFAQRGILATGIMNLNLENEIQNADKNKDSKEVTNAIKADYNLKLMDKDGNITSMEALKGKVIFINFWATWCPPCIAEMPSIKNLYDEVGDDVAFVILSVDKNFETAKAFNSSKGYNLPIYAAASRLPKMYESTAIPTTYVIDAKGNLALKHKGMADYNAPDFKEFLKSLK
ncbi:TlpA family protein disulfide reductase [Bizionia argentinensis JUB59]|uniref:TlpA family protein disulfide reductase n=1 Tax=Bizionia argentinensis JUB59 TaxID=1046627 RepID=G2E9Z8_9FLAO|nr:TlpA disulfide reductase family protein [Bizionia argentinensis]EGV44884.1 TlpA family protein disulfide reductase [Bizionia argentinensis JUB59]